MQMGSGMPGAGGVGGDTGGVDQAALEEDAQFIMGLPPADQQAVLQGLGNDGYAIALQRYMQQIQTPIDIPQAGGAGYGNRPRVGGF